MSKTFVYNGVTFALADSWAIRQKTRFLREVKSDETAIMDSIKATTHHVILNSILSQEKSELGFFNLNSLGKKGGRKVYSAGAAVALAIQKIVDEGERADLTGEFLTLFEIGENRFYGVAGSDGFVWADSERLLTGDEEVQSWLDEHIPLMGNYAVIVIPERFSSITPTFNLRFDDVFVKGSVPDAALIKKNQIDYRKLGVYTLVVLVAFFGVNYGQKFYKEYQRKKIMSSLNTAKSELPHVPPQVPWDGQALGTLRKMVSFCSAATSDFPIFVNGWERTGFLCQKNGNIVAVYHRPELVHFSAIVEKFGSKVTQDEKNPDIVSINANYSIDLPIMKFEKEDLLPTEKLKLMLRDMEIIFGSSNIEMTQNKIDLPKEGNQVVRGNDMVYEDPNMVWWDGVSFKISGPMLVNIEFPRGCTIDSINYETVAGENFSIQGVCYARKDK